MKRFRILFGLAFLAAASAAAGEEPCLSCHREVLSRNPESPHWKAPAVRCESCHGDGAKHAAEGDPKAIRSFKGKPAADVCGTCHQDRHVQEWKTSRHAQVGIDCIDCHAIHTVKDPKKSCQDCH